MGKSLFLFLSIWLGCSCIAAAQSYCVVKTGTHLRAEPSEKSAAKMVAPLYMPLQGLGVKKNEFVQVQDYEHHKYWVLKSSLSTTTDCLVVTKSVPLRSGPGHEFRALDRIIASRNNSYMDLGGEDGWTQVQDSTGRVGWILLDQTWKPKSRLRISFDDN